MNSTLQEGELNDASIVLTCLKDVISCLAATVLSSKIIKSFDFNMYSQSYYPQTCSLLDFCAKNKFKLFWCQTVSIQSLPAASTLKRNWVATSAAIEIGAVNWVRTVNMLPYDANLKRIASVNTWFFNWRFIVIMRSNGAINLSLLIKNFYYVLTAAPTKIFTLPFLFFCCLIPQPVVRFATNGFRFVKNYIR